MLASRACRSISPASFSPSDRTDAGLRIAEAGCPSCGGASRTIPAKSSTETDHRRSPSLKISGADSACSRVDSMVAKSAAFKLAAFGTAVSVNAGVEDARN
jgi:hypothetical protein